MFFCFLVLRRHSFLGYDQDSTHNLHNMLAFLLLRFCLLFFRLRNVGLHSVTDGRK